MSIDSVMTALADAIRMRMNWASTQNAPKLSIEEMTEGVLILSYGEIPAYHYTEASRVIDNILTWKKSHTNSLIFGAVSDAHVAHNNATYEENTKASIRHAAFALETVGMLAGCDFIANLGDNCWENGIDTDNAYLGAKYARDALFAAICQFANQGKGVFCIPGNHDKSDDTQKLYDLLAEQNTYEVMGDTEIRNFGYYDFTDKRVRVICLNSVDYLNASGGYGMSYEQKDWLMRALDLSAKSDAAQWQILILSHIPVDFNFGDYNTYADLQTILNAYVNGATASITVNSSYALNETPSGYATYSGGKLVYDYSGKNSAKIIANIHGHVHTDAYGKIADNDILRMATPNACFYLGKTESYPNYGDYSINTAISRTAGTATDTCVVFYCIDLGEQAIYAFAYGAGRDRVASYKDAAVYSVSYKLTNVTSSTTASGAVEGSAFTATLTPADGAELASVVVTMGGVDVTASAYADGVVNISSVTGDIVITAVAEVVLAYTNLFSASDADFVDGYRFSSSGGNTSGADAFLSGYIAAVKGDVIRVRCPGSNYASGTGNNLRCICTYNSSKGNISCKYPVDVSIDADGLGFSYTITEASCAFVRVSGNPKGNYAGFIVTKNEEIV